MIVMVRKLKEIEVFCMDPKDSKNFVDDKSDMIGDNIFVRE